MNPINMNISMISDYNAKEFETSRSHATGRSISSRRAETADKNNDEESAQDSLIRPMVMT